MAAESQSLTLRNLSATPITVIRVSRFPQASGATRGGGGGAKARPITARNVTDVGNLAHNLHNLVSWALPIASSSSTRQPSSQAIAENAQAFSEEDVSIAVPAFCSVVAGGIGVAAAGEVLRLAFTTGGGGPGEGGGGGLAKFRADLNSWDDAPSVQCLTPDTPHQFSALFHRRDAHLTLLSRTSLSSWQARLRDDVPLSALSIPGTHNTPTCYTALPSVRCQAVPPAQQLQNGIRFFDIRCQVDGPTTLSLVHGAFPISFTGAKDLSEVLAQAYSFLSANPHETVIISLKREGRGGASDARFAKVLKAAYIDKDADKWHVSPRVPTLGEARGKAVLFRRFALPEEIREFGVDAEHWEYNSHDATTTSGTCRVQDFCEVRDHGTISRKVEYVKEHLTRSVRERDMLFVNFLSGSNFWRVGCWPERIAGVVNVEAKRHLAVEHHVAAGDGGTGVLVCDYVGERGDWGLVRLVVAMNGWIEKTS